MNIKVKNNCGECPFNFIVTNSKTVDYNQFKIYCGLSKFLGNANYVIDQFNLETEIEERPIPSNCPLKDTKITVELLKINVV